MASAASNTTTADSVDESRRVHKFLLLWIDAHVHSNAFDTQSTRKYLKTIVNDVKITDEPDECFDILEHTPNKQTFVIISGSFAKELVPRIHDLPGLDTIYIFCGNKQYHKQWSRVWKKVRAVETDIKLIGEVLKKAIKQFNQDDIAMSIVDLGGGSEADLNRLEPSFLYTSLLKNAILNMNHNLEDEMAIFKDNAMKTSDEKDVDEDVLVEFQKDYRSDQAIFWYTKETFLYPLMNGALRNLEGDIIVDMGFFIHDLHRQIEELYNRQLSSFGSEPFLVYRGQGLPKEKFTQLKKSQGGLLGFNNFLSTSRDKAVSTGFAQRGAEKPGNIGLLFVMSIDPKLKLTPFAKVEGYTAIPGEEEILFSMHTIFRIGEWRRLSKTPEVHEVQLVLTSEDDPKMKKLHDYMHSSIEETGWHRIGWILDDMHQLDKAEEIYQRLLSNETDEVNRGSWNHHLGMIKRKQGDYSKAKQFFEKALEIGRRVLPEDDGRLASSYSQLGLVCSNVGDYSQALSNYERALAIKKKTLPETHPALATCYGNIGLVCLSMGDYPQALSNHKRALAIKKKILPETHPDLATSYNNIGSVYSDMGDHTQALMNYKLAMAIDEKTLPKAHPDLASSYHNIGCEYYAMQKYSTALEYLEKALRILIDALPANHPSIASTRQWIVDTKKEMNK